MRLWFCGNGPFAALCLRELVKQGLPPQKVLVGAPRPAGRGNKLKNLPAHDVALELSLAFELIGQLNEEGELLDQARKDCDVMLVVDFGQKVDDQWLQAPRLGALNIHPSLLPRWRGAAPVQRALMAGDDELGVTVFYLAQKMDAGDILARYRRRAQGDETTDQLFEEMARQGVALLIEKSAEMTPERECAWPQDEGCATYASRISKEETNFDATASRNQFLRAVRALGPKPGAGLQWQGERLAVLQAAEVSLRLEPGTYSFEDGAYYGFSDGAVQLLTVVPAGRKAMSGADWARGMKGVKGTCG